MGSKSSSLSIKTRPNCSNEVESVLWVETYLLFLCNSSMAEKKTSYTPSREARFVVSKDPYSQGRFSAVQTAINEVQQRFPAVVQN
jgi:hypothetical protein